MKYLIGFVFLLSGQSAVAVNNVTVSNLIYGKVIKSGQFELVRGGQLVNDTRTSTGKSFSKPVLKQLNANNRIAVQENAYFAYQYRIGNLPDVSWVDLRRVLIHPKMTLPNGSVSMGSDFIIKRRVQAGQVIAYDGYGLNEAYELVEGDWIFQLWYQNKILVEQKFTTYRPAKKNKIVGSRLNL